MVDTNKIPIFELYDIWHKPLWHSPLFWLVVICLTIGIIGGLIILIWYVRNKKKVINPQEYALKKLAHLESGLVHGCNANLFYTELIAIMKRYCSYRYEFECIGHTEREVVERLSKVIKSQEIANIVNIIFENAITSKYAAENQSLECMQSDIQACIMFVKAAAEAEKKPAPRGLDTSDTLIKDMHP